MRCEKHPLHFIICWYVFWQSTLTKMHFTMYLIHSSKRFRRKIVFYKKVVDKLRIRC